MSKHYFCNNCGVYGHTFNKCKEPITSIGVIAFTKIDQTIKYLMIRRKDSLGYVDLIRGKYNIRNNLYIQNIIDEMTLEEKKRIQEVPFEELWNGLWNRTLHASKYKNEKIVSEMKYNQLREGIKNQDDSISLKDYIEESKTLWEEPEWGFPKGRRNYKEKDIETALRELREETNISYKNISIIYNIKPYDEIFIGSNFKSYRNRYFIGYIKNNNVALRIQESEVGDIGWYAYEEVLQKIRPYDKEKKVLISEIHKNICENEFIF